jgi:hypothetical protein
MSVDWDAEILAPVMSAFGEGAPADQSTWPIYMPASGALSFPLASAVFDSQSDTVDSGDLSVSTTRTPVLGVRLALFQHHPKQDDRVFIPSVKAVFMVDDVRPDGHGWAKLVLMTAKDQFVRMLSSTDVFYAAQFQPALNGWGNSPSTIGLVAQ